MPMPQHVWDRIRQFIADGRYGRIELDVVDGRVANVRFVESIKVSVNDCVDLREVPR